MTRSGPHVKRERPELESQSKMKIENENGIYKDQDNKTITNKEFIIYFYNTILNILHNNGYIIDNDKTKSFKNEIATFIYKYSDNSSQ